MKFQKQPIRIKVLTIVSRMNVGGVSTLLAGLAENINQKDFNHTIITGHCENNEVDLLETEKLPCAVIYSKSLKRSIGFIDEIKSIIEMRKIITQLNPDIVHTHTSKAGIIGRLAVLSISKKPILIHTYHGHLLYGYFSKRITFFIILIERIFAKFTDVLVGDSSQVKQDLLKNKIGTPGKWQVIAPGIRILPYLPINESRISLGLLSNSKIIVWAGRFTDIKDPFLAVQVFANLSRQAKNMKFIMVGGGELRLESIALANKLHVEIMFPGWTNKIENYVSAADLLLLTSKNEGFGMVLAEAGWYKIPSLSTNVGGVTEFIENEVTGFLVDRDPIKISDKILELFDQPEHLKRVGENASQLVKAKFTSKVFTSQHEFMYKQIMKKEFTR